MRESRKGKDEAGREGREKEGKEGREVEGGSVVDGERGRKERRGEGVGRGRNRK